jgi:hypothetical protein
MRCLFLIAFLLPAAFAQTDVTASTPHVQAELENNIKAKKAKPGDKVKAKTISPLTLADGTSIPVASEIYGHVTEVTNDASGSSLAIAFDQLEIKNKKTPVKFSIRAAMVAGGGDGSETGGIRPDDVSPQKMAGGRRDLGQTSATPPPSGAVREESMTEAGAAVAAQTGTVVGMHGVKLQVDDSPQHASKFQSSAPDLQLSEGLNLMLAVVQ